MIPSASPSGMLRALLVDDEPLARQRIRMLLERHADVQLIAECADGPEAVIAIDALRPDLVFLDVEMPTLDGFGVLERLGDDRPLPSVVLVSAHDRYAVPAFDSPAVDYLLKPVSGERLDRALARVRTRRAEGGSEAEAALRALIAEARRAAADATLPWERRAAGRIAVKHEGQPLLLTPDEIEWVEAEGNYVRLHARGTIFTMRETMKRMETRLPAGQFVRIRRDAIINIDAIDALEPWQHGEYVVKLAGGVRLMASRVYVGALKALIMA